MRTTTLNRHLLTPLLILLPICIKANEINAGSYQLETRMLLPHLEEMRRTVTTKIRCINENDIHALFPILMQPGMAGCRLVKGRSTNQQTTYSLKCPGKNAAEGTALLRKTENGVSAELNAKMGGKNMTFSQFSKAELLGRCSN